ncbi:MAG: type II secretion system GspH family protein [Phycisphaerales bacterium]|nr:type II secretion system GspH family protein [Phycisphaerales bacterium]
MMTMIDDRSAVWCRRRHALSLVELVIVIVIMGTVAAIAAPRMSQAAASARLASLSTNLRILNGAAEQYATEHEGRNPAQLPSGAVDPQLKSLVLRLTSRTTISGEALGLNRTLGPYLREIPVNPMNGRRTIRLDGSPFRLGTHGWRFDTQTNTFSADHPAVGVQQVPDVDAGAVTADADADAKN